MSCLGILSREGGISGEGIWRVMFAGGFGVFPRQDILAALFGGSSWLIYSAGFSKQEKAFVVEQ